MNPHHWRKERIVLKGIFLNGLKEEIQAELKLYMIGSLEELMDRACYWNIIIISLCAK